MQFPQLKTSHFNDDKIPQSMHKIIRRTTASTVHRSTPSRRMGYNDEPVSHASPSMIEDYRQWKAVGEGGTSPTWAGFLSCLTAEKTMAFDDTLSLHLYQNPKRYATGWSRASSAQSAAAQRSFLKEPLPERQGQRSRAKRYVYPQREKNAADYQDLEVKQVRHVSAKSISQTC